MKIYLARRATLFFLFILALLVVLAGIGILTAKKNIKDNERVNHSYRVLYTVTRMRSHIKDDVINSASYLIDRKPVYLANIKSANDSIAVEINDLINLTADNHPQHARSLQIAAIVKDIVNHTGSVTETTPLHADAILPIIARNNELMRAAAATIDLLIDEELKLFVVRKAKFENGQYAFLLGVVVLVLLAFVLEIVSFVMVNRQMRLRRQAEEEVKRANADLLERDTRKAQTIAHQDERYRHLLDNMMEGIHILSPEWKYIYANDAAQTQSGCSFDVANKNFLECYPGIEHTTLFARLSACMRERKTDVFENEHHYPDGSTGYFELIVEPVEEGLFILSLDITERKKRELEIQRRIREAKQILFKISHEVRQPVANLQGLAEIIEQSMVSEEELHRVCNMIKKSARELDERTKALSDYVNSIAASE